MDAEAEDSLEEGEIPSPPPARKNALPGKNGKNLICFRKALIFVIFRGCLTSKSSSVSTLKLKLNYHVEQ